MNDWPFYDELREDYEKYRAEMHIPTGLFDSLLSGRVPERIGERCRTHMESCKECSESFDCFKELVQSGRVSGIDDLGTVDDNKRSQQRAVDALKRRIAEQQQEEMIEPQLAGPDDEEIAMAYGVEEYGAKGDGKVHGVEDAGAEGDIRGPRRDVPDDLKWRGGEETQTDIDKPPRAEPDDIENDDSS